MSCSQWSLMNYDNPLGSHLSTPNSPRSPPRLISRPSPAHPPELPARPVLATPSPLSRTAPTLPAALLLMIADSTCPDANELVNPMYSSTLPRTKSPTTTVARLPSSPAVSCSVVLPRNPHPPTLPRHPSPRGTPTHPAAAPLAGAVHPAFDLRFACTSSRSFSRTVFDKHHRASSYSFQDISSTSSRKQRVPYPWTIIDYPPIILYHARNTCCVFVRITSECVALKPFSLNLFH